MTHLNKQNIFQKMMLVSSNSWHYSWPAIPERRQILQVWWPQRVKEQAAKDHIQHPSKRLHFKALKLTQENFSEFSLSWEWSHQPLWKYSHTRASTVSLATEVAPRSDVLETLGFLKHYQMKTNIEDPLTTWCFSIAHLLIYLGAGKDSPLLVEKYFCFFCVIDFYLAWLVCWLPICKISWVPFLNASLVEALSFWKCWVSAEKGKGNSYLSPKIKTPLEKMNSVPVISFFIYLYNVFRKEFNYSNFIPNVLINKFDLT